jgi:dephospho-CoA kinase
MKRGTRSGSCRRAAARERCAAMRIGLTGIFGSGKSAVAHLMREAGVPVISCDAIVQRLLRTAPVKADIVAAFGREYLTRGGAVDRRRLAARVFRAPADRRRLERIIHPRVFAQLETALDRFRGKDTITVVEVPLLFETKSEGLFDKVITVSTPSDIIRKRLSARFSSRDITVRWHSQIPLRKKEARSDYVVDNGSTLRHTRTQVHTILADLMRRKTTCLRKSRN